MCAEKWVRLSEITAGKEIQNWGLPPEMRRSPRKDSVQTPRQVTVFGQHRSAERFSHPGSLLNVFLHTWMPSHNVGRQDAAAAAIFLAAKVEEFRVHIKDVMMVTYRVRHKGERRLVENSDVSVDLTCIP